MTIYTMAWCLAKPNRDMEEMGNVRPGNKPMFRGVEWFFFCLKQDMLLIPGNHIRESTLDFGRRLILSEACEKKGEYVLIAHPKRRLVPATFKCGGLCFLQRFKFWSQPPCCNGYE